MTDIDLLERATYAAIQLQDAARRGEPVAPRDASTAARIITDLVRELSGLGVLAVDRVELGEDGDE